MIHGERKIPWKRGMTLQRAMGLLRAYWPSESSKKKRGSPVKTKLVKYGMRNAPGDKKEISLNQWIGTFSIIYRK